MIIGKDESVLPFAETLGQELAVTCVIQPYQNALVPLQVMT